MILIVGSTGLLGFEICSILAEKKKDFRALVRTTSDQSKVDQLKNLGAEIVIGDLKDMNSLAEACKGVTQVISTASSTLSRQEGDTIQTVDLEGQLNLVNAAKSANVEKFVFISFRENPMCGLANLPNTSIIVKPFTNPPQSDFKTYATHGASLCTFRYSFNNSFSNALFCKSYSYS